MTQIAELPIWAAILTGGLVLLGASFTLIGALGLLRLQTFYERIHAPTLGTTGGAAGILLGSIVYFSVMYSRPVVHEVLIAAFLTVTTPVSLMLIARSALYRDRTEGSALPPGRDPPRQADA